MASESENGLTDQDWAALGDRVRARRSQLRISQEEVAERGGPSSKTVYAIERGTEATLRPSTLRRLDEALGWSDGTSEKILAGEAGGDSDAAGDLDWAALGRWVLARRTELRLPQDLVGRGGPSEFTIRRLERAEVTAVRPKTKLQLEQVLQAPRGIVDRILKGTATDEEVEGATEPVTDTGACACAVGSSAWIERELATERRINAVAQVFQAEMQRLLALVEATRQSSR